MLDKIHKFLIDPHADVVVTTIDHSVFHLAIGGGIPNNEIIIEKDSGLSKFKSDNSEYNVITLDQTIYKITGPNEVLEMGLKYDPSFVASSFAHYLNSLIKKTEKHYGQNKFYLCSLKEYENVEQNMTTWALRYFYYKKLF